MKDFGIPLRSCQSRPQNLCRNAYLIHDVFQRIGAVDGEADEQQVRLRVRERPQPVILLLAGCVPQCKLDPFSGPLVFDLGDVIFKDGWHVFLQAESMAESRGRGNSSHLWKDALAVTDEQTRLATSAVANDDKLLGVGRWHRQGRTARMPPYR